MLLGIGPHHLHTKKTQKVLDFLMYPIALGGPLALLPQVWQLYATHDVSSLSLVSWSLFIFANAAWFAYGLAHKAWPVVLTNTAGAILNGAVVIGILLYAV